LQVWLYKVGNLGGEREHLAGVAGSLPKTQQLSTPIARENLGLLVVSPGNVQRIWGEKEKRMAQRRENREDIKRALADLGWEIQTDDEGTDSLMGAYGKYHLMVNFEDGKPTSVIISYVGKGGEILSRKWPGVERLPSSQKVVRALS
jgi:hypothetical protein